MRLSFTLILLTCLAQPSLAWWDTGHRVVARIALQSMSDSTRRQVQEILRHHPDPEVRTLEAASLWPDLIRDENHPFHAHHRGKWHYQNRPVYLDQSPIGDGGELLARLALQQHQLTVRETSPEERAIALCWVAHLVGDIHQPLHNCALFGPEFPRGDQSGNLYFVWLGERRLNLHQVWDSCGCRFIGPVSENRLQGFVDHCLSQFSQESFGEAVATFDFNLWSDDGVEHCRQFVYRGVAPDEELSSEYLSTVLLVTKRQATLAGYRLALLLEKTAQH